MTPRALCLVALLALGGCCMPDLDVDPSVVLGSGEVEFVTLGEAGQEVDLVNGVQGGWHVWGSVRVTGMDWRDLLLEFTVAEPGGSLLSEPSRTQAELSCCEGDEECEGLGEIVGFPVLVDEPALAAGRNLTLRVVATDPDGLTATASRTVTPIR